MSKRSPADPLLVVGYIRVSTDAERQALGAEGQRVSIERWAAASGKTVVAWYLEEVSGGASLDKRPLLLQAIAAVAQHGAALLVVQRLDRFSRDPVSAALAEAELRRHGAGLAVTDGAGSGDDPTAELVRGILLSVARFEKSMIRARIKAALAVKKTRGEMTGAPPFGHRVGANGKTLETDDVEAAVRDEVRALRATGLTIRAVVEAARQRGLVGRAGRALTLGAVHALVRDVPTAA